jgi:predicted transposase/invertase (TIGR01784 family)
MDNVTRYKILGNMTTERDLRNQMRYAIETATAEGLAKGMEQGLAKGMEQGIAEGRAEGLKEGVKEGKQTTARNLKKLGVDSATIAQATGLSLEEIEVL